MIQPNQEDDMVKLRYMVKLSLNNTIIANKEKINAEKTISFAVNNAKTKVADDYEVEM